MGLASYLLGSKAIDRISELDTSVNNNYEWIEYLYDRVNELEWEVKEIKMVIDQLKSNGTESP